jgi:NTE family protein
MNMTDFNITETLDYWTRLVLSRAKYRNLVFKGGGVRGVAYIGALEALEGMGILDRIERVAGSSAGAVAALLVSFRLPMAELVQTFNSLDMRRVPQSRDGSQAAPFLKKIELAACPQRLLKHYGWYSSEYFYHWTQSVIAGQCGGDGRATFTDFRKLGFRDLYIVVSNLSRRRAEVFSAEATPDTPVADAVRISMSIPLFFEALRYDGRNFGEGDLYVDGGLYDNFPTHIFDDPSFARGNLRFRQGVNGETLGLYVLPERCDLGRQDNEGRGLLDFIDLILDNLYASHQVTPYDNSRVDQRRTICIRDCGISPTNFNLGPEDASYRALYEAGYQAVREFFCPKSEKSGQVIPAGALAGESAV